MSFPSSSPSEQGIDPAGIVDFVGALDREDDIEPHGIIIQRHGVRVAEGYWRPHDASRSRLLYSLSKTFTGTALALQIGEGRIDLDDLVSKYLPEAFDTADAGFRDLRIRHIASMATGHNRETLQEAREKDRNDVVRGFLQIPPDSPPGTLFAYNQPPVIALSTILQQLAGETLIDYLRPRLFEPLGIGDVYSEQMRSGMNPGFTGIYTNLDAIARLGQLYLDNGRWNGRQLLPETWVPQASRCQMENPANLEPDWRTGYGFLVWISQHGYRGDGAFGQYMVVLPEQDAVIAMFSCTANMQRGMDLIWTHLLPAMKDSSAGPGDADKALAAQLAGLSLPTAKDRVQGKAATPLAARLLPGRVDADSHRSIDRIDLTAQQLTIHEGESHFDIPWSVDWIASPDLPIAASAAQAADGSIAIDLVLLETPHRLELTLHPDTGTFDSRWPRLPYAGGGRTLVSMCAPR